MLASTTSVVSNLQKSANNNKSSEKNIGGHAANNTSGDTNHLHNKQWKETKIDYVLKDIENVRFWLSSIHFDEYLLHFVNSGYDMPTITRMTPADLTAIGITKPAHRRKLTAEIQRLNINDGIPNYKPESLFEWLRLLHLEEPYYNILCHQGYDTIERVIELTWEDLEEIGIKKLGHQKKITLAIKKMQDVFNEMLRSSGTSAVNSSTYYNNITSSCPDIVTPRKLPSVNSYQLPTHYSSQDVTIMTNRSPNTSPASEVTPEIPQLKTFQQLPNSRNGYVINRQMSETPYYGVICPPGQIPSSRGRSLESLDCNGSLNFGNHMYDQRHYRYTSNNHSCMSPQKSMTNRDVYHENMHGYETDSELIRNNDYGKHQFSDAYYLYEIDGTATLHRPKSLLRAKPIAKITAKRHSRQINDSSSCDSIYDCKQNMQNSSSQNEKLSPLSLNDKPVENAEKCQPIVVTTTAATSASIPVSSTNSTANYRNSVATSSPTQVYATISRSSRKTPPPPPKRTNSLRNPSSSGKNKKLEVNHDSQHDNRCNSLEAMQEQAFATCVKSLASRFSMCNFESLPPLPARNHPTTPRPPSPLKTIQTNVQTNGSANKEDFPPPPPPHMLVNVNSSSNNTSNTTNDKSVRNAGVLVSPERFKKFEQVFGQNDIDREASISSGSSEESMPFANDNVGTIKQRFNHSSVMSAPTSTATSPNENKRMFPQHNGNSIFSGRVSSRYLAEAKVEKPIICSDVEQVYSVPESGSTFSSFRNSSSQPCSPSSGDVIDDIENMLANLSSQLDMILENEINQE